jgi:hypothetical protein
LFHLLFRLKYEILIALKFLRSAVYLKNASRVKSLIFQSEMSSFYENFRNHYFPKWCHKSLLWADNKASGFKGPMTWRWFELFSIYLFLLKIWILIIIISPNNKVEILALRNDSSTFILFDRNWVYYEYCYVKFAYLLKQRHIS